MTAAAGGTSRATRLARLRARVDAVPHLGTVLALGAIVVLSAYLRSRAITAKLWIDEGLSIGIAHHGLFDIPGVLELDGSPPLYYLLLHLWMVLVGGDGEARTHALSLVFATATIPSGWWLARRLFGERAAWCTAALVATVPFLTYYAQETRMYALMALLSLCSAGTFGMAYALRDRRAIAPFVVLTAAMIYTHNWGLFFFVGLAIALAVLWLTAAPAERRPLLRDGVAGLGGVVLLYLPWIPTLLEQARHTGAPWAERPPLEAVLNGLHSTVGGAETALLVLVIAAAGLLSLREESRPAARAALAITVAFAAGVSLAWLSSQASPAWANRYFAAFLGPAMLLVGAGIARFGKVGLVSLAIILVLWFDPRERQVKGKGDAYRVARTLEDQQLINPRDVVLSVHPEQGPVLRYYLGADQRYADALGWVPDPRVFDWRDALDRLEAIGPKRVLRQVAPEIEPGQHLVLILPIIRTGKWGAPWTSLVRRRSAQWEQAVDKDPRFQRIAPVPKFRTRPLPRGVRAVVYLRR